MENIISQLANAYAGEVTRTIDEHGLRNIDRLSLVLLVAAVKFTLLLISKLYEAYDRQFSEDKVFRKEHGLVVKESRRNRSYMTPLGLVSIKRTYYRDKKTGDYVCPVDELAGISKYARLSPSLCSLLVNQVSDVSMQKSAEIVTGGEVSAQSVCNKLREVGLLESTLPESQRSVDELHIFADEDHVSMRGGKNKSVPLVCVCEGIRSVSQSRRETINPVYFTGEIEKSDELWDRVYAYVDKAYGPDGMNKVCVHGDGANWIRKGVDMFSGSEFFLDGYHLRQRLFPFLSKGGTDNIYELLRNAEMDEFKLFAEGMIQECKEAPTRKTLRDNLKYILNNRDGIMNRLREGSVGSCTEAMVSHVFSERLSRDPMAWSDDGVNAVARLRVFRKNGGVVCAEHFERSDEEKQRSELADYSYSLQEAFKNVKIDSNLFEQRRYTNGKVTPISTILKSKGSIKTSPDFCKN